MKGGLLNKAGDFEEYNPYNPWSYDIGPAGLSVNNITGDKFGNLWASTGSDDQVYFCSRDNANNLNSSNRNQFWEKISSLKAYDFVVDAYLSQDVHLYGMDRNGNFFHKRAQKRRDWVTRTETVPSVRLKGIASNYDHRGEAFVLIDDYTHTYSMTDERVNGYRIDKLHIEHINPNNCEFNYTFYSSNGVGDQIDVTHAGEPVVVTNGNIYKRIRGRYNRGHWESLSTENREIVMVQNEFVWNN